MAKVLFLPNYLGGGFGHIGRCLALARAFLQRGWEVALALNGPHVNKVKEYGFEVHIITSLKTTEPKEYGPTYTYVPDMSYQIVRDGFDNSMKVKIAVQEIIGMIKMIKPDILIGDGYLLTWLAGRRAGIPVVQMAKSIVHPKAKWSIWWEDIPAGFTPPDPRPVFNPIAKGFGLPEIERAEDLLSGDLFLLPSIPVLDPIDPLPVDTYYVGPIIRKNENRTNLPIWFSNLETGKPTIYVTIGGAAGFVGSKIFFELVRDALSNADWQVIVSTGGKINPGEIQSVSPNIRFVSWAPGAEMIARSDLVIFHGGYTRMEILLQGLPSVVIPFHSEQEYYGRLMESAGVSMLVSLSDGPYRCVSTRWKGGNLLIKSKLFSVHIKEKITLEPYFLRTSVARLLHNEMVHRKVWKIKKELEALGGCEQAIRLIEKRLV